MTHLSHHLPWNTLSECLQFETVDDRILLKIKVNDSQTQGKILFFSKCLEKQIETFALSEKNKLHIQINVDHCVLTERHKLELEKMHTSKCTGKFEDMSCEHLLILFKEWFIDENLQTIYNSSFHIKINPTELLHKTYSNWWHYGIARIMEDALQCYIHLNLLITFDRLHKQKTWHLNWINFITQRDGDYCNHARIYQSFYDLLCFKTPDWQQIDLFNKKLFRFLVNYHVFLSLFKIKTPFTGGSTQWSDEIRNCIWSIFPPNSKK